MKMYFCRNNFIEYVCFDYSIFIFFSEVKMPKYKSKFQDEWLTNEKYRTWIRRVKNNPHVAYCYCCSKEISVAGQGTKQSYYFSKTFKISAFSVTFSIP